MARHVVKVVDMNGGYVHLYMYLCTYGMAVEGLNIKESRYLTYPYLLESRDKNKKKKICRLRIVYICALGYILSTSPGRVMHT